MTRHWHRLTLYIHTEEQTPLNPACSQTAQWWTRRKQVIKTCKEEMIWPQSV